MLRWWSWAPDFIAAGYATPKQLARARHADRPLDKEQRQRVRAAVRCIVIARRAIWRRNRAASHIHVWRPLDAEEREATWVMGKADGMAKTAISVLRMAFEQLDWPERREVVLRWRTRRLLPW